MIAFAASSQSSDTIILKKTDAIKVLQKGLEAKQFEAQRDLLLNQVDTLKARIIIKETMIVNLSGQISDFKSIISSKDAIILIQADQRKILETNIAELNKKLKRERRAKKWTAFAGLMTTGLLTYLFITK